MFRLSNVAIGLSVIALAGCKVSLDVDDDGDGFTVVEDCNDLSAATYPGAPEACDGVDNNCDGAIDETDECTDNDEDGATANVDCNDEDATSFPGAPERCDGADNDCDGTIDEETECFDDDGDGQTEDEGDCNDANANTFQGADEVCDGLDNDCDDEADEGLDCSNDGDNDGFTVNQGDCDDTSGAVFPGATETCDQLDNNCNGDIDEGTSCYDDDNDGQTEDNGDCDDANPATYTGANEVCDGIDNNCNDQADEGIDCSGDGDGDGFTVNEGDCDDTNPSINPEAPEICNEADEDCDGTIDEETECSDDDEDGFTENEGDCDDANPDINPGALDVVDGIDNDCDGLTDESESDCDVNEFESNDTLQLADNVSVDELVCGTIGEAGDVDWYQIGVSSWTTLWLDVDANLIDSPLDSVITLYRDTAEGPERIAFNDDDPFGNDFDSFLEVLLPEAGTYYFTVKSYEFENNDSEDEYFFGDGDEGGEDYIYEVFTFGFDECDTEELEPNDDADVADVLVPGDDACGFIDGAFDFDYFEITVADDTFVTFDVDAFESGTGLEAQLTIRGTDGLTQLENQRPEGTDDPFLTYYFEDAGTYYVEIESEFVTLNASGGYLIKTFSF